MHISDAGLALIEEFEGFSSRPYWDAYGRVWTRGYGETEGITQRSPPISRAGAQHNLRRLIEQRYEWAIRDLNVDLSQNQWDALCSFAWNLGAGIFTGHLRALLQARNWDAAAQLMLSYDHAGGQLLPGLAHRRRAEMDLFLRPWPTAYVPADEQRWIREYDHLGRGPWATVRRRALRVVMTRRRKLIWHLAEQQPGGWGQLNRAARYRALRART